ncbi:MAG TPA: Flp family type IVb pilin [Candidatus Cybelea sp.]|nr:Flp family type IVb pilin [Candidatus Cybelea sp.]
MRLGRRRFRERLRRFGLSELGATAIEYGLIAALISVVIIASLRLVGNSLKMVFNNISSTLSSASGN